MRILYFLFFVNYLFANEVVDFTFRAPTNSEKVKKLSLWATKYYLPSFSYSTSREYPLLTMSGKRLGPTLDRRDWCIAALEGSVQIKYSSKDFRVFNFDGFGNYLQVDCSPYYPYTKSGKIRFRNASGPYGDGYFDLGYILFPYRTIAVDPDLISIGTVIYIPAARGKNIRLKNGKVFTHDGYFFAADTGGAIKGNHIDVFQGVEYVKAFDSFVKSTSNYKFTAYVINNKSIKRELTEAHYHDSGVLKPGEF